MNKTFKTLLAAALSVFIFFILTACKGSNTVSSGNAASADTTTVSVTASSETTSEEITEPDSSVTVYTMNCIINEIDGDRFVAEKLVDGSKSGILYEFHFASEGYNEGEEIVVEYKYPIADSFPYGLTDVNIYKVQ